MAIVNHAAETVTVVNHADPGSRGEGNAEHDKARAMAEQISLRAEKKREKGRLAKKMESDYGRGAALAFKELDPRQDMVRTAESRFQCVLNEEQAAKRMRRLHELEAQDALEERKEAVITITVQAWKCKECNLTTESQQAKLLCEQNGHAVQSVQAKRGRWECRG